MKFKSFCFLLLSLFFSLSVCAQLTQRQERNLIAFTKLYGYIRFFYPSDEAQTINWYRFANYGSIRTLNKKNDDELKEELTHLFKPFAPKLAIYNGNGPIKIKNDTQANDSLKIVSWQHVGIALSPNERLYKSIRIV